MSSILLYTGSAIIIVWGIAHILPVRSVVSGFGQLSETNRKIITMEWVAEGFALMFIGVLVLAVTLSGGTPGQTTSVVYLAAAGMLLVMAVWTLLTGARTPIIPIKLCPAVKTLVAVLFVVGGVG